jgi:hypothetical protein
MKRLFLMLDYVPGTYVLLTRRYIHNSILFLVLLGSPPAGLALCRDTACSEGSHADTQSLAMKTYVH